MYSEKLPSPFFLVVHHITMLSIRSDSYIFYYLAGVFYSESSSCFLVVFLLPFFQLLDYVIRLHILVYVLSSSISFSLWCLVLSTDDLHSSIVFRTSSFVFLSVQLIIFSIFLQHHISKDSNKFSYLFTLHDLLSYNAV